MVIGQHSISDIYGCDPEYLRDERFLNASFMEALNAIGARVLKTTSHKFSGCGGVTGIFLLAESHASYHTYPEYGYIAVDFFTCGKCAPENAMFLIQQKLHGRGEAKFTIPRGFPNTMRKCQVSTFRHDLLDTSA